MCGKSTLYDGYINVSLTNKTINNMVLLDEIKSQMNEKYNEFEKTVVPKLREVAKRMIPQDG